MSIHSLPSTARARQERDALLDAVLLAAGLCGARISRERQGAFACAVRGAFVAGRIGLDDAIRALYGQAGALNAFETFHPTTRGGAR